MARQFLPPTSRMRIRGGASRRVASKYRPKGYHVVGTRTAGQSCLTDPYAPQRTQQTYRRAGEVSGPFVRPIGHQAACAVPCGSFAITCRPLPAPMVIWRGFKASGTTRFKPTCSRPFCRSAPSTTMWSARTKRRSKARPAMPRCSISKLVSS